MPGQSASMASSGASSAASPTGASPRSRGVSLLTLRILAVNLLVPLLFLAGLLYLSQYEDDLLEAEFNVLRTKGDLIAAAIGEGAATPKSATEHRMAVDEARAIIMRLSQLADVRVRLFDAEGVLVADSDRLAGPGGVIEVVDLPPLSPHAVGWMSRICEAFEGFWRLEGRAPLYVEHRTQSLSDYDEALRAFENGKTVTWMRRQLLGNSLLLAATPVSHYKQTLGVVMVSQGDWQIQHEVHNTRFMFLCLFLGILALTVLLSFYLANSIIRPIRKLALAAEHVRKVKNRRAVIPDISRRRDEIGELSVSLRDMTDTLWLRMDATERFAADVSHEIKNPLTSLRSAVEALSLIRDPEKQQRLLAILKDDVGRLDRLITDISSASRLDAELSRAETSLVDLRPILQALHEAYDVIGAKRNITLEIALPPEAPLIVLGLEDRLVQVIRNLLGNALSFSPDGGRLRVSATRNGKQIAVVVEDEGPGIPPGKEEAIFERFYTERPAGEKFGEHSGLGLSISQQIIAAHNGSITAGNRLRPDGSTEGARFVVTLPAAP